MLVCSIQPRDQRLTVKRMAQRKHLPGYLLLWGALFFLLFHFAIWPMVWQGIFLPRTQWNKQGLRVESFFEDSAGKTQESLSFSSSLLLTLENPISSLSAYAVWQIPKKGIYLLRLHLEGKSGTVLIDSRPVITLKGRNALISGETQKWLGPGPHFLELRLKNKCQPGGIRLEASGPGQLSKTALENYEPKWSYPPKNNALRVDDLSYPELGNIETWLGVVRWGEYFCLLGFLSLGLLWLARFYGRHRAGKVFPTRWWKYFFLGLAVFSLTLSSIAHTQHDLPPVWSDGLGYYSYLPAYLIYHDLTMESLYEPTRHYDYPSQGLDLHPGEGFLRHPVTGRYLIKYPLGTALLMLPFFLLGHLVSPLLISTPDGFSLSYQFAIDLAAVFYLLLGLILLFRILIQYFSPRVVLATLLGLFLGTNLLAYATVELSLSHVYSFFLVCLMLYLVPRWYADPSRKNTLFLGVVSGLIPLVRNTNAVLLLFLPLYGITTWALVRERAYFLWQKKTRVVLLLAVAGLVFFPQCLIWKITANHFLVSSYTYPFERFYFLSPSILKVLFSPHHGLFVWSPLLFFSFLGLGKMNGPLKAYRLPIVVCLLLQIYFVSSWYLWYFGWSFGHRAFVDTLGMFAIPLAGFFAVERKKITNGLVILITTLFIALTFYWFIQYFQGILPGEMRPNMTWSAYKKMLVNPQGMVELGQWLNNPKLNNHRLLR